MPLIIQNWGDVTFTAYYGKTIIAYNLTEAKYQRLHRDIEIFPRTRKNSKNPILLFKLESLWNRMNLMVRSRKRTFTYSFSNFIIFFHKNLINYKEVELDL